FVLGNLVWAAGYNIVLSHYVVDHVLIPSSFLRTFGHQVRWMKSTRYSRPRGHLGSGLTFAVPFGLLGLISATALGHPVVGIALLKLKRIPSPDHRVPDKAHRPNQQRNYVSQRQ